MGHLNHIDKRTFLKIFRDHWDAFVKSNSGLIEKHKNWVYNVEKMLSCRDPEEGFVLYYCSGCGSEKKVGFPCKGRLCPSCSRRYVKEWVHKMRGILFPGVTHRHVVLTVPDRLRVLIFNNFKLLKVMADAGAKTVKELIEGFKKGKGIEPGIIMSVSTAGRSGGWNPHLHLLVTEGGLDKNENWQDVKFFHYEILRKKWQYHLLGGIREVLGSSRDVRKLISELYDSYPNGFVISAKPEKRRKRSLVKYLIQYVVSPPIAVSRIVSYDEEEVRYWYRDHRSGKEEFVTLSVLQFIGRMIQHIPEEQFKMIRHYGLYSRRKVSKVREALIELFKRIGRKVTQFTDLINLGYRELMIKEFGKDPLRCEECGKEMVLSDIWVKGKGYVYSILGQIGLPLPIIDESIYRRKSKKKEWRYGRDRESISRIQPTAAENQLCLFEVRV